MNECRQCEIILDELKEVRKDIKVVHEEVHKLELGVAKFQSKVKATVATISVVVGSAFSLVTAYFKH